MEWKSFRKGGKKSARTFRRHTLKGKRQSIISLNKRKPISRRWKEWRVCC
jgi:hypothetical protein